MIETVTFLGKKRTREHAKLSFASSKNVLKKHIVATQREHLFRPHKHYESFFVEDN